MGLFAEEHWSKLRCLYAVKTQSQQGILSAAGICYSFLEVAICIAYSVACLWQGRWRLGQAPSGLLSGCVPQPSTQVTRCHGSFFLLLVRMRKFHTFANEKGGCCWDKTSILSSPADSLWTSLSHLELTISTCCWVNYLDYHLHVLLHLSLNCTSCKSSRTHLKSPSSATTK